jgi:hypothetical protein
MAALKSAIVQVDQTQGEQESAALSNDQCSRLRLRLPGETVDPAGSITGEKSKSLAPGQTPGSPVLVFFRIHP